MVSEPSVSASPFPRTLKKYEILRPLAEGGMAEVLLARTTGLGDFERLVVIKRPHPQLATDPQLVSMFLQEARLAAQLHHVNIVQVFDVDMVDGCVFCAMEYLHGQSLAAIQQQAVPLDVAISILVGVCAGLDYAHGKKDRHGVPLQIVHRDVSPQNIFVTYDGTVKVIDFGIARAANQVNQTRFGTVKGKPGYMSPEQCRCESIDRRSDIFCLGILLYELTTGQRLWQASNEWDYLQQTAEGKVMPPRQRLAHYPAALETIVLKALARTPSDRQQTAGELQHELELFAGSLGLQLSPSVLADFMEARFPADAERGRTARPRDHAAHLASAAVAPTFWRRRAVWLLAGLGVLAAVLAFAVIRLSSRSPSRPVGGRLSFAPAAPPAAIAASPRAGSVALPSASRPAPAGARPAASAARATSAPAVKRHSKNSPGSRRHRARAGRGGGSQSKSPLEHDLNLEKIVPR